MKFIKILLISHKLMAMGFYIVSDIYIEKKGTKWIK